MEFKLPRGNVQGPSCGITALAVVADVHFNEVWNVVAETKPANWLGSVHEEDIRRVLKHFGVRYRSRHYNMDISVRWFTEHYARPGQIYLMDVNDHIALLKDGVVLDQRGTFRLTQKGHWRLHRIYTIL